ncbi:uncharacterized protein LOC112521511 isoform X1 [Cynara cardunculus var. scolymus]|uniref:uncharacterized protein LOC112521511 isoform X1 n=1 Tax=Cynara cardunculus var. scolymus TaxID=59895 RepID=UPI000D62E428|nr:uncharacterized protein LOC112521511 isoform X1 [Cynara cardunculus var. scolymus]XP_024986182.1 uncharacterized protein LOC112521511 isoform X1 [Cynara cardunculus var. scolymus]XP_024986183.1 uncharacterized protein LOC112521511 isoform X1 [Cynara cardunculus var. scolymus]
MIVIMSKDKDEIKSKLLVNGNQEKDLIDEEIVDESEKLLLPKKGGLSTNSGKKQKVQWNDDNGDKLTEVLEYQPRHKHINVIAVCGAQQPPGSPRFIAPKHF